MKNKKAAEGAMWTVVIIALLLLFFLIYSGALSKLYGKLFSETNQQVSGAEDSDNDGVSNLADKCPCNSGELENSGCPAGYKPTGKPEGTEARSCLT